MPTSSWKRLPSSRIIFFVSLTTNVILVTVLFPATFLLRHAIHTRCDVKHSDDVISSNDVTAHNDVTRYCFKGERKVCRERGLKEKSGEKGETLCCNDLGNHLFGVFQEKVQENLENDFYRARQLLAVKTQMAELIRDSQATTIRPAAHVGILPNGNLTGADDYVPRIQWQAEGEETFLTGGIIHRGDRLSVTKPGYYYVYTGLQFSVDPDKEQHGAIVAYLFRTVNGTRESQQKLMSSRESSCRWTRGDATGPVSMYMAGIYRLRPDEEISVRTASHSLLDRSPSSTYLGLHMV